MYLAAGPHNRFGNIIVAGYESIDVLAECCDHWVTYHARRLKCASSRVHTQMTFQLVRCRADGSKIGNWQNRQSEAPCGRERRAAIALPALLLGGYIIANLHHHCWLSLQSIGFFPRSHTV